MTSTHTSGKIKVTFIHGSILYPYAVTREEIDTGIEITEHIIPDTHEEI